MPTFKYIATSKQGKKITGEREAETREEVASFLHDQDLVVLRVDQSVGIDWKKLFSLQIGGVPLAEKVIFAKQLATMLSAGLPILQALDILVQQTKNPSLKEKLSRVYKNVESGVSLSESFAKDSGMFNELQVNLLVAGEKSGNLNEVMIRIAEDLEKSKKLRSKIIGAMIYPIIIAVVMVVVIVMMMVFMVPAVKALYLDFGVTELPWITQVLVTLSELFTSPVGIIVTVLLVVMGFVSYRYYASTPAGRRNLDRLLLKVPVFGPLTTKIQLTQFNHVLTMLIQSGVPILEALRIVANSLGNVMFREAIQYAAAEVLKGSPISIPLAKSEVFPLVMLKMIATGEETGKLDKVTADMALYYEAEVEETTSNLTKLMEPFILLVVGIMVGFMAVAIYLPLYSLGQYIG